MLCKSRELTADVLLTSGVDVTYYRESLQKVVSLVRDENEIRTEIATNV